MRRPVLLILGLAASACNLHQAEETSSEEFRFEGGGRHPVVEVRLEDGSVEVSLSESSEIEATFVKRARSLDPQIARALLERVEVLARETERGIRLESRIESAAPMAFGADLRADLRLRVPRGVDLSIYTRDGSVEIVGISGEVFAETGDGSIRADEVSGALTLRTGDGSISGRDLDADLDASTGDGRIELRGRFGRLRAVTSDGRIRVECREPTEPSGDWMLRTQDGSISLSLPASISANLDATTADGDVESRHPTFEGSKREGRLEGKLGGGGYVIVLSTMDGRIEIE